MALRGLLRCGMNVMHLSKVPTNEVEQSIVGWNPRVSWQCSRVT